MSAMERFLQIPELVTHVLTFLDAYSLASLASVHQLTTKVLQETDILNGEVIRRSGLPLNTLNEDTLEQQRLGIRLLVNLLLKLENGRDLLIETLHVICENCPGVDQSNRVGVSNHGIHWPQQFTELTEPSWVSPLGVVLLEEAEGPFASSLFRVRKIQVRNLKDFLLTALGSRLARQEEAVETLRLRLETRRAKDAVVVECKNTSHTRAFLTLMQKCSFVGQLGNSYIEIHIFGSIYAEGWTQLAEVTRLAIDEGQHGFLTIKTSKHVLQEARLEDLRAIWDLQAHLNWLVLSRRDGAVQIYRADNPKTKEENWVDLVALWKPS